jgi:hypothetical protein
MLDVDDVAYMRECLDEVAPDTEESITYRQYKGIISGNQAMGNPDRPNYTDLDITAATRDLTLEEVASSGGAYVLGDIEIKIRQTALTNRPSYSDRIVYEQISYKPKSIGKSYLGAIICWKVRAGRE